MWDHTCRLGSEVWALYGCDASRVYDIGAAQIAEARFRPREHRDDEVRTFYTLAMACDFVPRASQSYYERSGLDPSQWPSPPGLAGSIHSGGLFSDLHQTFPEADFGDEDGSPDGRIKLWHNDGSNSAVPHVWVDRRWVTYGDDDVLSAERCAAWIAGNDLDAWKDDDLMKPEGTGIGPGAINPDHTSLPINTGQATLPHCPDESEFVAPLGVNRLGRACQGGLGFFADTLRGLQLEALDLGHTTATGEYIRAKADALGLGSPMIYRFSFDVATWLPAYTLFYIGEGLPLTELVSAPPHNFSDAALRFAQVEAFRGSAPINRQTGTNDATPDSGWQPI